MDSILTWMEGTALAQVILGQFWVFPTLETLHFIGLILLIGALYVVDLRLMGLAPRIPVKQVMALIPIALVGFVINLVTGVLFLFADPFHYYSNFAFRLKMLAVLLAGLNLVWFIMAMNWQALSAPGAVANPRLMVRWIAAISLLLWTSVIVLGRMIPYLA